MNIFIRTLLYFCFLVGIAGASDLQQQQSTLYPYKSIIEIQDDFLAGINTNGNIGMGWGFAGGSVTYIASEVNRFGIIRRDTSAVAGTISRLDLNVVTGSLIDSANSQRHVYAVRLVQNDTDTAVRIGPVSASFSNPPANGMFFEKLYADTNWFCVNRSAGVQTRTDTGIAIDVNFHDFEIARNSSGVVYKIDGTPTACGTQNTNIPTVMIDPTLQIINQSAASKLIDIDYYQLSISVSR